MTATEPRTNGNAPRHRRRWLLASLLALLLGLLAWSYSWTYTPHGRINYLAALSLHLLTFENTHRPDPGMDFELSLPVNLLYAMSFALPSEAVARTEDITIPGRSDAIPARIYWPPDSAAGTEALPVIVYYHGGGFVVGSVEIFDALTRSIASATGSIVISVDYRLAPRHPYPAAVEDAYDALLWAAEHAERLGGDPGRLLVAGDSAGGNLATVTALRAEREQGPALAGQILYYPGTDLTEQEWPSAALFTDGYGLSTAGIRGFRDAYIGHVADPADPYISPLYTENLQGVAPALVVTAGFDPLTDSAKAYVQRLREAGVEVAHEHYPGMIHGFMSIPFFSAHANALSATAGFVEQRTTR